MRKNDHNILSIVTPKGEMNYSVTEDSVNTERYIEFLDGLIHGRQRPLILIVDHASFHGSKKLQEWARARRTRLRMFFLPKCCRQLNPDEQVWNEVTKITNLESNRSKTNGISKSVCIPHCVLYGDIANESDPFPSARHTICLDECPLIN